MLVVAIGSPYVPVVGKKVNDGVIVACMSGRSTRGVLISISFGDDMWDGDWAFGIWLSGSVVGRIGGWCCTIRLKNGDVWVTENCVTVVWNDTSVCRGVTNGTVAVVAMAVEVVG